MSHEFVHAAPMAAAPVVAAPAHPASRSRVALLVDGENLSQDRAGEAIMAAAKYGDLMIRRVYGHAPRCTAWLAAPGFAFRQAGTGKNSADLLLTVEAMDLMLHRRADILAIASSDTDFSHLATHLRETGHKVIGIGRDCAFEGFGRNCSHFVALKEAAPTPLDPVFLEIEAQVRTVLRDAGTPGLNHRMLHLYQFKIGTTPEKT